MKCTVTVLLFVCIVAFYHSCYGIKCYSCVSNKYSNPKCNKISGDKFLKKFKINYTCTTLRINYYLENEPDDIDGIIRRSAFSSKGLVKLAKEMETLRDYDNDLQVDLKTCREDGCNND